MDVEQKYQICVRELADYAHNAGFSQVLLGLSGGADSAVAAALCVDAFGAENVHGFMLPGPYSTDHSITDARQEADALGIDVQTVSITGAFDAFARELGPLCGGSFEGLASENTQARCRMVVLMALSNHHGWMLVNTGNKSEAMMGYSTLYGDTAGAFAPLGGLYKTDVYAVGRYANELALSQGRVAPIPEHVFTKPPSAELSPDQSDEAGLGIDYPTLDKLLIAYYEHGLDAEEAARKAGIDSEEAYRLIARADGYAFKRTLEPPYPQAKFY